MAIYDMGQNSWHAEDCGGYPFCNGCGHVVDGFWYPGPPREDVPGRLEYLRGEIRAGRISYGEISELEVLAEHIEPGDVELLQWAGVPEHAEEETD